MITFGTLPQLHYVDAFRDDGDLDELTKRVFKAHWLEESQHAQLDHLDVDGDTAGADTPFDLDRRVVEQPGAHHAITGRLSHTVLFEKTHENVPAGIDGFDVVSTTNVIDEAIDGVTLNLLAADPDEPFTLDIANDHEAVLASRARRNASLSLASSEAS